MPPEFEPLRLLQVFTDPATYPLWCGLVFVLGLLLGSFFNVCIYRIPVGMSVLKPKRSLCFRCGSAVRWYDNLPVLSWFILGGKCRDCGARYGLRYAFVELLTGVIFLAIFVSVNPPGPQDFQLATLWYFAFAGLLLIGTFTDFDHWIIPDGVTIGGGIAALVAALVIGIVDNNPMIGEFGPFPIARLYSDLDGFALFIHLVRGPEGLGLEPGQMLWWEPFANAVAGAIFGVGLLYSIGVAAKVFLGKEGMGMGDVKLFAMIGGTLGIMGSLLTLVFACFLGVLAGVAMMLQAFLSRQSGYLVDEYAADYRPRAKEELDLEGELLPEVPPSDDAPGDPPLIDRLETLKRGLPKRRRVHHLPFGPWISLGALLVLIFQAPIQAWLGRGMF